MRVSLAHPHFLLCPTTSKRLLCRLMLLQVHNQLSPGHLTEDKMTGKLSLERPKSLNRDLTYNSIVQLFSGGQLIGSCLMEA